MDNLWSPWRSKYIESFREEQIDNVCIFCDAALKDVSDPDNLLIYKTDIMLTMLNLYPYNNGHLMIVPNRHMDELTDLTVEESAELMRQLKLAKKALVEIYQPQGFNIGANLGRVGGAGIDEHLHFHIVPRWNGDTNFMPVLGEVKVISLELKATKEKLLEAYQKVLNE